MVRASMASRWVVVNIDVGSVDGGKQRRVRKRCTLSFKRCTLSFKRHVKVGREVSVVVPFGLPLTATCGSR